MIRHTAVVVLAALSMGTLANEFHDADPRNTSMAAAIISDTDGELRLQAGGGGENLYGDGSFSTQTIVALDYYTQTEDIRLRVVNFDDRFGGVYIDLADQELMTSYTMGYMVPLTSANKTLTIFPSFNYSYVDFDTGRAAGVTTNDVEILQVPFNVDALNTISQRVSGDDEAHLMSLNVYVLRPWNATHYSIVQFMSGSSYGGFEMNLLDAVWLQGIRTTMGENKVNLIAELRYTEVGIEKIESDDTTLSVGVNFIF